MFAVSQHIEGICLNPREYMLDGPEEEGGEVMLFETEQLAKDFLIEAGHTSEQLQHLIEECSIFIEEYKEVADV